ncbi:membrane protein [Staphylococcus epidermidis APO35]|nr:membrane protein [Staphylococcus epidermidis CIM28]ESR22225.1 membrane protein [Staphylococcus epidermidis APO35]ESU04479.1 membrane protein [Staphylococcus epidermidis CIM37]ESV09082.1 membrane protein [Staphylococcus epidermidis MC28]ESV14792.1 membrane protein [Staphylococcus epidermidis WI05]ESV19235.1 membrane protein [Staphylococcus epidermidis WI09]ESV24644.1 membrane protein [Staphylococcus epidermidis CIM40]ESV29743.1 membrane protein [Staphylococcus epidermidis APO27]ESV37679.1
MILNLINSSIKIGGVVMLIHYGVPLLIFALVLLIGWLMTKMFIR